MRSWPTVSLPELPGSGPEVRVFDTASGAVKPTSPGPIARMYVCGITPYDATHLGHAATYITFDLLGRAWRDSGHEVHYVQNVTDIDDPLLERAVATGDDWQALALRQTELFRDDMTALRVMPPDHYLGAVESIPAVVDAVEKLRELGAVYDVDGDLYFRVHADDRFGSVTSLGSSQMLEIFGERGGDPQRPGKSDPLDCLLWQAARPDEPAWDTALGHGRPGWHIECVAIALGTLGMSFDVQGGGRDLAFPHHEMGASEAHVLMGEWPYARSYVHAGLVGLDGEKMSKSRGNLVFVSALRMLGHDPMAIRLALLNHHYRTDWEWTDADLPAAEQRLARWRAALSPPTGPRPDDTLLRMRQSLSDDLNAPGAVAAVDRWVDEQLSRGGEDPSGPGIITRACDALLGVAL
ncbi:MAG: cysteine--1-D-myo-inosityl 2-amino-2-deoxy-alpha-D-glucopyranoside ligase [Actinobacteria bacterium]|nr:cysteine--1-D-myo-inosityl 2-amino-2-deoxy-alpha-D-glucopyranoside ligase [Actinomycetota bacterium]